MLGVFCSPFAKNFSDTKWEGYSEWWKDFPQSLVYEEPLCWVKKTTIMKIMPVLFSNFWMKIRGTNKVLLFFPNQVLTLRDSFLFHRAFLRLLAWDGNGRNSRNILWFFHVYNVCALFRVKLRVREITSPIAEARQQLLHSYLDQVGQIFIFRDKLGISRIP